jgi:hypothetical protein
MAIERHQKFDKIPGLDSEIKSLLEQIEAIAVGKNVTKLPPVAQQRELALFNVKQSDGTYLIYRKINGAYKQMKVDSNSLVFYE